jgi:endonuclease G
MKATKLFLLAISVFRYSSAIAQVGSDIEIIDEGIYKSYFDKKLKEPLYVVYKLYKGGGKCTRKGMEFKDDRPETAKTSDYKPTGRIYDKGHLCNAEDFASDCALEEKTFEYFNCVPQTRKLNRGIWKHWETQIRKDSQTKHLLIICGGIYGGKTIGADKIAVPDFCWKVVIDESTKKQLYCLIFPNDNSDTERAIPYDDLLKKLNYKLVY